MEDHQHIAANHSASSENRIHSDDVAQTYGFRGALVAGVQVFGHLSYPLSAAMGEDWMRDRWVSARFLKPAYHGDRLNIVASTSASGTVLVECHNDADEHLASLTCGAAQPIPRPDETCAPPVDAPRRAPISWQAIELNAPFATKQWTPSAEENQRFTDQVGDDLPLYQNGIIHPHLILHYANQALMARFILPAWLHVGSNLLLHRPLEVGEAVEIHTVPIEKWQRKGHDFIKLYIAYRVDRQAVIEIEHTAVFKIADRA